MADGAVKRAKAINWQAPMRRVLYALLPIVVSAVYFYGWRSLVMLALVNAVAFAAEYAFVRRDKQPVTAAVFVTASLFTLSLPPLLPFWMAVVGIVFGVVFGKMVFGGFGRNVFNPALTGRAFIYISFGDFMTARCWTHPVGGVLGGFAAYANTAPDAITQATPGTWLRLANQARVAGTALVETLPSGITADDFVWNRLLLGNTAGCIGGTSAVLVVLGGAYLLWTKTANHRIVLAALAGYMLTQGALYLSGVPKAADPMLAVMSGSVLFAIFFYATDPVSACKTNAGRWLYGALVGILSSLIAVFSVWPAGAMFAILLANMFGPITDYAINSFKNGRKPSP